jgi:hypothetical protein
LVTHKYKHSSLIIKIIYQLFLNYLSGLEPYPGIVPGRIPYTYA